MRERLAHQRFDGDVVQHVAGTVDHAVLPVGRERIERHIGDDAKLGQGAFQGAHRALRQTLRIPGLAAVRGLGRGIRHREQRHSRDAEPEEVLRRRHQQVDGEAFDTGHRGHRLALARRPR